MKFPKVSINTAFLIALATVGLMYAYVRFPQVQDAIGQPKN